MTYLLLVLEHNSAVMCAHCEWEEEHAQLLAGIGLEADAVAVQAKCTGVDLGLGWLCMRSNKKRVMLTCIRQFPLIEFI